MTSKGRDCGIAADPTARRGKGVSNLDNARTVESKVCSRCGTERAATEFYTKGTRVDAACKDCVRSGKRRKRASELSDFAAQRLAKVARFIAKYELSRLEHYHAQIREILERCEAKSSNREEKTMP